MSHIAVYNDCEAAKSRKYYLRLTPPSYMNYHEHNRFYYAMCNLTINTRAAKDFPYLIRIIR